MNSPKKSSPPQLPLRFLRWFCRPDFIEDVEGDLTELYESRLDRNAFRAYLNFLIDVMLLLRPGVVRDFKIFDHIISIAMLENYIKIAFRNALKYKGYTAINLLGLVVGIASSTLIFLWVHDEMNVDQFHTNKDNIYQLFRNMRQSNGQVITTESIPKPAADLIKDTYPEVNKVALMSWPMERLLSKDENNSKVEGHFVSPEFLELFSFEVIQGDSKTALKEMSSILISEQVAERYFGYNWKDTALGQSLRIDNTWNATVTGVFKNPGRESSIQFDWLIPAEAFFLQNDWVNDWGNGSFGAYFTVDNDLKAQAVSERALNEINDHTQGQSNAGDEQLIVHKFSNYYLNSNFDNGVVAGGRIKYVRIMTVIAIFLLLVASINFMNLATARADRRSKEIGLRKVMGGSKTSIGIGFYMESFLLTSLAVVVSVVLVLLLLPYFNALTEKTLFIDFTSLTTWIFLIGTIFIVGVLSGTYPAIVLPKLQIMQAIKGTVQQSSLTVLMRKGLVIFQFGISSLLIIGTLVIHDQLDYILNKDLGINKENLLILPLEGDLNKRLETYRNELQNIPEVTGVTVASGNPINYGRTTSSAQWDGKDPSKGYEIGILLTDENFIDVMGMDIVKGRGFASDRNDQKGYLINETAAKVMGYKDPVNQNLSFWGSKGKIIGVVKDFHTKDLYKPIAPLIISLMPQRTDQVLIRIQGHPATALKSIEDITKRLNPAYDFEYSFIEKSYAEGYKTEMQVSSLANIFTVISIIISCLGLFGLSAYTAERRSREIGVRKVHGASIPQILLLLSKDYSKLMILAFLFAIPFGYFYAEQWLDNFEFRTGLNWVMFLLAGIITFVVGVATISLKSYQAASVNPVKSLKEE